MVVNSINFLLFFGIVFFVYYFPLKEKTKGQNVWLLLASYCFYGVAAWKMVPLLLVVTVVYYMLGHAIARYNETDERRASLLTTLGVVLGVGVLGYFKYLNFCIESVGDFLHAIGLQTHWSTLRILVPVGISFFTFKLISYVIEIHRQQIDPETDFVSFATYIAFFPTLLSGPIDRPGRFLPQLHAVRPFDYSLAVDGSRQILWGMFKKMVIADNIAVLTDATWQDVDGAGGGLLVVSALLYSIQLYADFSGYSDMAIGVGKLLGFRVAVNFRYPFFAVNIADFWRRWHISLTAWLTDYVFMPLNLQFRNWGKLGLSLAIVLNLVVVGLWHGANWTFVVFGLFHGLLFIQLILSGKFGKSYKMTIGRYDLPVWQDVLKMAQTFLLITLANLVFRADDLDACWRYIHRIYTFEWMGENYYLEGIPFGRKQLLLIGLFVLAMIATEWKCRDAEHGLSLQKFRLPGWARIGIYYLIIVALFVCQTEEKAFIYFQF